MISLEQVENLRKHANVSYEEAKEALEFTDGDMLDALIYLEKQGKVEIPKNQGRYSTGDLAVREDFEERSSEGRDEYNGPTFTEQMGKLWTSICKIVHKGNINQFEVWRYDRNILSVPVNLLIIALFFCFWITIPALIVGLFLGCNYKFKGPDLGRDSINNVMDNVSDTAESLKQSLKNEEYKCSEKYTNEENKNE